MQILKYATLFSARFYLQYDAEIDFALSYRHAHMANMLIRIEYSICLLVTVCK